MNKEEIQKRVLHNGEPLAPQKFNFCEKTNTFSSDADDLVIDFEEIDYMNVKVAGRDSIIKAGFRANIKAWNNANIEAGDDATIKVGWDATIKAGWGANIDALNNATIKVGDNANIKAGFNATIKAGGSANIEVNRDSTIKCDGHDIAIINRNVFEAIAANKGDIIQICPCNIPGHLRNGIHSETGKKCIIKNGLLTEV